MAKGLMKTVKGMALMSSSIFIDYVVNLIITYVLARLLTQADYGEVAAITVMVGFADIFWQMGVGPALVQKKDATEKDILTAQTLNLMFGVVLFSVVNIFAGFWVKVFSISNIIMFRIYSTVFLLNSYIATPMSLAQRNCNFKLLSKLNVWGVVFYGVIAIILAKMGFGPWALIYATLLRYVFKLVLLVINVKLKFSLYFNKESAKSLLFFGSGHTLARIFNYIANNGDTFVVNKTLTKAAVGAYTKTYSLIGYPASLIGNTLDHVMFPILSGCQDDHAKIRKFLYTCTSFVALMTVPLSVTCVFCSEDLVLFFLGENWVSIVEPFNIMIVALFFRTAYRIADTITKSIGKVYYRSVIQIVYAVSVVLGAYVGHFNGLTAIAFYVTIAFVLNYFLMTGLCMYFIKANVLKYISTAIGPFVYGFVALMAGMLVKGFINQIQNHFLVCAAWAIFIFGIYALLFLTTRKFMLVKELNESFDSVVKSFFSKLKKKNQEG